MEQRIKEYFEIISKNFIDLQNQIPEIILAVNQIVKSLKSHNKIIFCGNGGSASDAQHLAAEFIGRYKDDRPALAAIAITTDTSAVFLGRLISKNRRIELEPGKIYYWKLVASSQNSILENSVSSINSFKIR